MEVLTLYQGIYYMNSNQKKKNPMWIAAHSHSVNPGGRYHRARKKALFVVALPKYTFFFLSSSAMFLLQTV